MSIYQRRKSKFTELNPPKSNMTLRLVSIPVFPTVLLTGSNSFTIKSESLLDPPQEIIKYTFSIPVLNVSSETEDGAIELTIPEEYDNKSILVKDICAADCIGNTSRRVSKYIDIRKSYIDAPIILSPVQDSIISEDFPIVGSNFTVIGDDEDSHRYTEYKISHDIDGRQIVISKIERKNLEAPVITSKLNTGEYYIFMRYQGKKLGYSSWSYPLKFSYSYKRSV